MPAAVPIALGVSTAIAGYSAYETNRQGRAARREARTQSEQQAAEQRKQEQALRDQKNQEANQAASIALRRNAFARRRDSALTNRSGTILTSPLGIPAGRGGGGKTLTGQ